MTDHSALDREAVIDLMDGKPTTLRAGILRYLVEVAARDELQPRARILNELGMLLAYPWPGDHLDLRDELQAYASSVAAYAATFPDFDKVGLVLAEVADLLIGMLRRTSATAPVPGNCEG